MKNIFSLSKHYSSLRKKFKKSNFHLSKKAKAIIIHGAMISGAIFLLFLGVFILWFTSLKIPDLASFDQRLLGQSTKIFDKTGQVLLYDLGQNVRRTVVSLDEISDYLKKATIAIEDAEFYNHSGIKLTSLVRATIVNLTTGKYSQGGSTITQQVIKNSLLTKEKTISRKLKEILLAIKLERVLDKDQILHLYLNEAPYGGTIYGIEEASLAFFGKKAKDLNLVESAYLAALPQAPTYYSPYGKHRDELDERKNLVLLKMLENDLINKDAYDEATKATVTFLSGSQGGIKAPHFVMFIRQYLEEQYGDRIVAEGGLKVTTTIDLELQKKAEDIVNKYALENDKKYNASNASLVAIDAKTGQILVMVGSRDYFDKEIEGNYNIATAKRQPGSSFKPFIYVKAFEKGYRPETVLFDLKTQFSTNCSPVDLEEKEGCYSPENYDGRFRGPMTLRSALAQSINVPAVKLFYLVGMKSILELTKNLGITTLTDPSRYGLSLVLGGGEVTLLDMTGAYSVFAQNGEKRRTTGILKVEDQKRNILEEWKDESTTVLDKQATLLLNDVLRDNNARIPSFSPNSSLFFPDREVAAKTGTTNDYRDTWILGYTPQVAVGAWAGNNDNSPIDKKVAGMVVAPMWHAFMDEILKTLPDEKFERPAEEDLSKLPPAIRGVWQGPVIGIDSDGKEKVKIDPHSILYFINKDNPLGNKSINPLADPQFSYWEYPVRLWAVQNGLGGGVGVISNQISNQQTAKTLKFSYPKQNEVFSASDIFSPILEFKSEEKIKKVDYFINGTFIASSAVEPFSLSINLGKLTKYIDIGENTLKVIATDATNRQSASAVTIFIR